MDREILDNLKQVKAGKECQVNGKCCPIGPVIDGQIHPIGFIGKNHSQEIIKRLNTYDDLLEACEYALLGIDRLSFKDLGPETINIRSIASRIKTVIAKAKGE